MANVGFIKRKRTLNKQLVRSYNRKHAKQAIARKKNDFFTQNQKCILTIDCKVKKTIKKVHSIKKTLFGNNAKFKSFCFMRKTHSSESVVEKTDQISLSFNTANT